MLAGNSVQPRDLVTAVPEKESSEVPAQESPGTTGKLKLELEKKVPPPPPAPPPGAPRPGHFLRFSPQIVRNRIPFRIPSQEGIPS